MKASNSHVTMTFDHPLVPMLGRLLMTYVFVTSGVAKVLDWSGNVAYMNNHHLHAIPVLLAIATGVELGGSICLVTGYQARLAAFVMFVYLLAVTVLLHNYWAAPTAQLAGMQETHFRKNLAILGGLLMITWCGAGPWAFGQKKALPRRSHN